MNRKQVLTAIIYDKKGRVLSIGKNSYVKTHPYQQKMADEVGLHEKKYLHAEIHAILKCTNLKKAHSIFVSRFNSEGKPMNAKPCPVCLRAIELAGIHDIRYTV